MLSLDQYFTALAPAIYAAPEKKAAVEAFYPLAQEQITASVWGKWTNKAVVLYSLHYYNLDVVGSGSQIKGPITMSKSGPDQEEQYASILGGKPLIEDFEATTYGRQYLSLRRVAGGAHLFAGARARGRAC